MVSFSSASFILSEESVAMALQSCISGLTSGFNVFKLSDRRFQFSVASNRIGHFIYGLKNRVWPDFICHFHLFKGDLGTNRDNHWHADVHFPELSARSGMVIKSGWLDSQCDKGFDPSSSRELAKFGLCPSPPATYSGQVDRLNLGCFQIPLISDPSDMIKLGSFWVPTLGSNIQGISSFSGHNFRQSVWDSIPEDTLYHILDLWQAGYSDPEVCSALDIRSVPSYDYILLRVHRCYICFRFGHLSTDCPGVNCKICNSLSCYCQCNQNVHSDDCHIRKGRPCTCKLGHEATTIGSVCNDEYHLSWAYPAHLICEACGLLGHLSRDCGKKNLDCFVWKVKHDTESTLVPPENLLWRKSPNNPHMAGNLCHRKVDARKKIWVVKQKIPTTADVAIPDCSKTSRLPQKIARRIHRE